MKRAFSMIELILAVVIVAITISTLPKIVNSTQRSNEFALKQELIFHVKTMLSYIGKFPWDSNAYEEDCAKRKGQAAGCGKVNNDIKLPIYPILNLGDDPRKGIINTTGANSPFVSYSSRKPVFDFTATPRLNFKDVSYGAYSIKKGDTEIPLNDIDDFDGYIITELANLAPNSADFVVRTNVKVEVGYIEPTFLNGTNYNSENITMVLSNKLRNQVEDIKVIKVTADDQNSDYNVTMFGYAFNIGESLDIPVRTD